MKHIITYLGPMILLGTLLVSVPRYAAAFIQAEPMLLGWYTAPVTGLGFGLLLELGIFYIVDSWFDARRRSLKLHWLLLLGVGAQLVLGPVIVAPAIVGHLRSSPGELGAVLTWEPALWAWAVVVAAAPALLLAAVAAASYLREPTSRQSTTSGEKPAKARYACATCGLAFATQPALNAHQRAHSRQNGKEPATVQDQKEINQ